MLTVVRKLDNSAINVTEYRKYSRDEISDFKKMFNNYKKDGTILSHIEFESNYWQVKTGVKLSALIFKFDEISFIRQSQIRKFAFDYSDFIFAVKSFALLMLNNMSGGSVQTYLLKLRALVKYTNYFAPEELKKYQDSKVKCTDINLIHILDFFLYFEDFIIDIGYNEEFDNKINQFYKITSDNKKMGKGTRMLPTFISMFRYEDIINHFIEDWSDTEKEEYFPVVLWWKITTVIPIRSIEFSIIPWACNTYVNGHYFLELYRSKIKGGRLGTKIIFSHDFESCYKLYKVEINKKIFDFIEEYKSIVDKYDYIENFYRDGKNRIGRRRFLLSERSYILFRERPHQTIVQKNELDYLNIKQLYRILEKFLFEIVYKKYDLELIDKSKNVDGNGISKIQFMDTRHFAIMNMVMLNYEQSTIKEVTGHEDIHSIYNYCNHMQSYTNCYIISVAKYMAFEKNSEAKIGIMQASYQQLYEALGNANIRYKQVIAKYPNQVNQFRKIPGGWCDYEENDLIPCFAFNGNHARCKHFIADKKGVKTVKEDLMKVGRLLSSELKTLELIIKNHKKIKDFSKKHKVVMEKIQNYIGDSARILSDYIILGSDDEPFNSTEE